MDDIRKKWGTIFMGDREATVEELDAMQEPLRREQVRQKVQEDYMERVREKATERARQILGEAYAERQKVLNEARAEARRQYDLVLAEAEKIRQSSHEGYATMQAELEKAAAIKAEAQQIREEARRIHENAFAEGHAAGVRNAEETLREFRGELGEQLAHVLQALASQFKTIHQQWRDDLAELTRAAVGAATGYILDTQHDAVIKALLMDALTMLENRATITVRVHPDDEKMVGSLFKAARERAPELQNWVVNGDSELEQGGFIVETSSGSVDARRERFRELIASVLQHLALPGTDLDREVREASEALVRKEIAFIQSLAPVTPAPTTLDKSEATAAEGVGDAAAVAPLAAGDAPSDADMPVAKEEADLMPEDATAEGGALPTAEEPMPEEDDLFLENAETDASLEAADALFDAQANDAALADPLAAASDPFAVDYDPSAPMLTADDAAEADPFAAQDAPSFEASQGAEDADLPALPETPESLPEPKKSVSSLEDLEEELFPLEDEPPATPAASAAAPTATPAAPTVPREVLEGGGFLPGS